MAFQRIANTSHLVGVGKIGHAGKDLQAYRSNRSVKVQLNFSKYYLPAKLHSKTWPMQLGVSWLIQQQADALLQNGGYKTKSKS